MSRSRFLTTAVTAAAVGSLLLAACGGTDSSDDDASPTPSSPAHGVEIRGDASTPVNELAVAAIADLKEFWAEQYPALYGEEYADVEGGLFALTPESSDGPECISSYADARGNAFYCKLDDSVAWDADGLLPHLREMYGDFVVPVVLAHEWGHAMQQRSGFFDDTELTVSSELQADCFAGAWARHARESGVFEVSDAELDAALAGILDLRDTPGTSSMDATAHGSGFDRVSAFQEGFDDGVTGCRSYRDGRPVVLELPFNDEADAASGGNAPYEQIVNGVPYDLEDFWSQLYPELAEGAAWTPLAGLEPFDPSAPPACGEEDTSGFILFYCATDDFVAFDDVTAMPRIYEQGGDFAVATLLATQWGLAALARAGVEVDEREATRISDCFAGGYAASVMLFNRSETSTFRISPGDLDEGIKALLVFRGDGDAERQGAGYDRVKSFRQGVIDGAASCIR